MAATRAGEGVSPNEPALTAAAGLATVVHHV
jgi:hypothetical protein